MLSTNVVSAKCLELSLCVFIGVSIVLASTFLGLSMSALIMFLCTTMCYARSWINHWRVQLLSVSGGFWPVVNLTRIICVRSAGDRKKVCNTCRFVRPLRLS